MLACVFHDFIRAQWVHVSLELNFTFECTHEVSSWQFNHETRPWGHENKRNMWNVTGIITIKNGSHNVGNICLANRPNEAVLLTRVYSFEIHPSDLFQFTSRDTAQSYGWTWWPLQSLKGPSTREITNRSPCVIRNSASSVHHPPLGLHMLQPAHSTQIMLVPAGLCLYRKWGKQKVECRGHSCEVQNRLSWFQRMWVQISSVLHHHSSLVNY
jgi:hypothetical protein